MTLKALMQRGGLRGVANANPAKAANHGADGAGTLARLALALAEGQKAANDNTDPLSDPATEGRRQRVLEMLNRNPTALYVLVTNTEADPEAVILTLSIRGRATCELRIPKAKYDGVLLLDLIERHGATLH